MPTQNIKPRFTFGCEFEGTYHDHMWAEFKQGLLDINPDIQMGGDGSIEACYPWIPIEIKTPKLPITKGLKLTEEVLDYLAHATYAGAFKTNSTCGLHVNVAEDYIFTSEHLKRRFYRNIIKMFNEHKVAKMFNRTNNRFCKLLKIPRKIKNDDITLDNELRKTRRRYDYETPYNYKYQSVALRPLRSGSYNINRRVEFRCLGNTDYQLKSKELSEALNHIDECVKYAFVETINQIN